MPTTLAQKFQIKPVWKLLLINPPDGMTEMLVSELKDNEVSMAPTPTAQTAVPAASEAAKTGTTTTKPSDAVLLFVNSLEETRNFLSHAISLVKPGGLFWIAYPKGSSKVKTDVNRDRLWDAVLPSGWRAVRQIAIDETWSALRFRPQDEVEK